MEAYTGTIILWPMNWAPESWAFCNGQTLQVNQYQALFSLIANKYGGDGSSTFNLPNLNGRVPVGADNNQFQWAATGGSATSNVQLQGIATGQFTLTPDQIPAHNHAIPDLDATVAIPANSTVSTTNTDTPANNTVLARPTVSNTGPTFSTTAKAYSTAAANTTLQPFNAAVTGGVTGNTGVGDPVTVNMQLSGTSGTVSTIQPWAAMYYIICLNGYYPPRP
jgi:microcystin-dependent protein